MVKKTNQKIAALAAVFAACAIMLAGCGGGGGTAAAPGAGGETGAISVQAIFPDKPAARSAAQTSIPVTVTISVYGYYMDTDQEFTPIVSETTFDYSAGRGTVKVMKVPIGKNHIVVASAVWSGGSSTIKGLITEVTGQTTKQVTIDSQTTAVAETAIAYSSQNSMLLPNLDAVVMTNISQAVSDLATAGSAYTAMTGSSVLTYMESKSSVTSISISPASATVTAGGAQTFTATVNSASGTVSGASVVWSVSPSTLGTITTSGVFTAGTSAGSGVLTAAYGTLTATAALDVAAAVTTGCGNSSVESGETCDDGNTTTETCTYGQTSCTVCDATCQSVAGATSYCGDGTTNGSETCDDGNTVTETCTYGQTSCTVCNATCQSVAGATSYCGDGTTNGPETCDDGNAVTEACTYGQTSCTVCDSTCQSVAGSTQVCGDGTVNGSETCDDGNAVTEACTYGQTSCTVCDSTCASVAGAAAYCGDSIVNGSETCDSGASNGQPNQCNSTCNGTTTPVCGNSVTEAGETCDDGNTATETCTYGQTSCTVCDATCQSVAGATAYCGDSSTNGSETCDDGNDVTETCTYGQTSCTVCDATCTSTAGTTAYCGDSVTNGAETCDDGNAVTEACTYGLMSCTVCDATCASGAGVATYCGDGTIQAGDGEQCDDGGSNTNTPCTAVYGGTCNYCSPSCVSQLVTGPRCGDGTVDAGYGEACDDGNWTDLDGCSSSCTIETFIKVDAGRDFACGLLSSGAVACWGYNNNGQLGDGTYTEHHTPVPVQTLSSGVVDIEVGQISACALLNTGGVKCWGSAQMGVLGNNYGYAGIGVPMDVTGLTSGVAEISMMNLNACARLTDGQVKCWGFGFYGTNGNGALNDEPVPVTVTGYGPGEATATAIMTGYYHACAMGATATRCWGMNSASQLGNGSSMNSNVPVDLVGYSPGPTAMSGTWASTCFLTGAGGIDCLGDGSSGQLGNGGGSSTTLVSVTGLAAPVSILSGEGMHMCAVLNTGEAQCWGQNTEGRLGDGTTTDQSTPVQVSTYSSGVTDISAGYDFSCAVLSTGRITCWGNNTYGQLGDGTTTASLTPVVVGGN